MVTISATADASLITDATLPEELQSEIQRTTKAAISSPAAWLRPEFLAQAKPRCGTEPKSALVRS